MIFFSNKSKIFIKKNIYKFNNPSFYRKTNTYKGGNGLKKTIILLTISAFLLSAFILTPSFVKSSLPKVKLYPLKYSSVASSIICTGRVEEISKQEVNLSIPVKIGTVYYKMGDTITSGDKLFDVDVVKTKDLYSSTSQNTMGIPADIQNFLKANNIGSISDTNIPDAVYASIDGVVTSINIESGGVSSPTSPLIVISKLDNLQIKSQINEKMISAISTGQRVTITGDGFKNKKYSGKVSQIFPTATQAITGSSMETVVDVIVSIDNPDNYLKPGFSANVNIITSEDPDAIVVPYECILQDDKNREYVFIYLNGRAYKRFITTGAELDEGCCVISGVKVGEQVLINPPEALKSGSVVKGEAANA
jgi:multidrug efflux pump subunit AcrA (membrane-fusion protein)